MVDSIRRIKRHPEPPHPRRAPDQNAPARILQPRGSQLRDKRGVLRVVSTIVFVIAIVMSAGLLAGLRPTPPPEVVREQEFREAAEEIKTEIAIRETDTTSWRTYDNGNLGFSISYPEDWDVEELPEAFDPLIVKSFAIQPRGKKYFREPRQIFPITLEVIEGTESELREIYAEDLIEASQQIRVGDTIVQSELRPTGEFLYLMETPDPTKWFVLKDSASTISDVSETEKEELRASTKAIIASFESRF